MQFGFVEMTFACAFGYGVCALNRANTISEKTINPTNFFELSEEQWINKNIIMSSFKSSGNIQKQESGPYRGFAYWMLISDPIHVHLAKTARANYWNLMELLQDSRRKDWIKPKWDQTL